MPGMQTAQLQHDEEPEEDDRAHRAEQVLPVLPEGVEMVMPGDNTTIAGELMAPVALEKGARFAIREGGRTVGAGTVTDVIE